MTNLFSLGVNSPLSPHERQPPLPPFSMLETNKHPRGVCNIGWGKWGRIADEKGVFIQTQNIIVSLKALVSVKCLNTFVHDCPSEGQLVYIVC